MIAYMEKFFKNKKSAIVLSLFAMALWGSAIPLIKTTYRVMDVAPDDFGLKILIAGVRFFMVGLILKKGAFYFTPTVFILLLYGAFISATAFSIWTFVLKFQDAGEFAVYKLFIPILGSIFSIIFLKESFTVNLLIALTLVIIGTVILNMKRKKAN